MSIEFYEYQQRGGHIKFPSIAIYRNGVIACNTLLSEKVQLDRNKTHYAKIGLDKENKLLYIQLTNSPTNSKIGFIQKRITFAASRALKYFNILPNQTICYPAKVTENNGIVADLNKIYK